MFPSPRAIEISSAIGAHFANLVEEITKIQISAHSVSSGEVEYFRHFFKPLETMLNGFHIKGISFRCRTVEIHQKPIVKYGRNSKCELGDYFVNIKYIDKRKLLGRKLIIYQFKMDQHPLSWKIDKKQLKLLCEWPTFKFGNKIKGYNTFTLTPKTPDLGSYWLASKQPIISKFSIGDPWRRYFQLDFYDIVKTSSSIKRELTRRSFNFTISPPYFDHGLFGAVSLVLQLMWRHGEFIEAGTPFDDFLDTLYRYVNWAPDPKGEFDGFKSENENKSGFWGVEILVSRGG